MNDLNTSILQKASGETRLNPDEQRLYLGTFRERVLLVASPQQVSAPTFLEQFEGICHQLSSTYSPLFLKLSPVLSDSLQISLMKLAQQYGMTASIIDEKIGQSPYALVFHTDHALNKENITLEENFPHITTQVEKKEDAKPSFWKKLFG